MNKQNFSKLFTALVSTSLYTGVMAQTYEHVIMYGQSLSNGHEAGTSISVENVPGCYMLGDQVWMNCGNTNQLVLNPLVSKPSACAPNDVLEPPVIGLANHLRIRNVHKRIIATSTGQSGTSIEELSKHSKTATWYGYFESALSSGSISARKNQFTVHCPALFILQGENNYGNTGNGVEPGSLATSDKNEYKKLLVQLKNDMQSDVKRIYKQTHAPVFYTYQTGAQWTRGKELTIGMAQLEASNEYPDIVCAGPVYPMTDYGGHLDANGYRWYGEMMAKAYYRHSILKEGFKPLQPLVIYRDTEDNTKLTIRFLVPQLPLVFDTNIVTKQPEYGFQVYNNGNRVMIKDFKIVGDCVEIYAGARLIGDVEVIYGSLDTGGHGNLRDSDDYEAAFPYIDVDEKDKNGLYIYPRKDDKPLRPAYEPKDEKGQVIYNRPYPLYNFCVAFYYNLPQGTNRLDIPMQGTSTLTLPAEKDVKVTASEGWLHIVAPQDLTLNHVGVYDLAGRPMLQISSIGNGQKDYDLSTLPQGLYVVHIDTSNGVLSQKVILQ